MSHIMPITHTIRCPGCNRALRVHPNFRLVISFTMNPLDCDHNYERTTDERPADVPGMQGG
jgi:hypothetical protein